MSIRIRLARRGSKKKPYYRIVVASTEAPRDGLFIENIGTYNPLTEPAQVEFKPDRLEYWMQHGAKPTDTVRSLLRKQRSAT
jgi:small subunit ribosomal protein S16